MTLLKQDIFSRFEVFVENSQFGSDHEVVASVTSLNKSKNLNNSLRSTGIIYYRNSMTWKLRLLPSSCHCWHSKIWYKNGARFRFYFRIMLRVTWRENSTLIVTVNQKSWLERDSKSHFWVSGPLLYQLSCRVNWEQYTRLFHVRSMKGSRNNLAIAREYMQCSDYILESSSFSESTSLFQNHTHSRWLYHCRLILE